MTSDAKLSVYGTKSSPRLATLWIGNALPTLEWACLSSWAQAGYRVDVYSYSDLLVPDGISSRDAREVVSESEVFANPGSRLTFAGFSNLFRYELLRQGNVIWIDADMLAGGVTFPQNDYCFGFERDQVVNGAVLGLPSRSAILSSLREQARYRSQQDWKWGQLGPGLLSEKVTQYGLTEVAQPKSVFYSLSYNECWKMYSPQHVEEILALRFQSVGLHTWSNVIRKGPPGLRAKWPPAGSFLDYFYRSVALEKPAIPRTSRAEVALFRLVQEGRSLLTGLKREFLVA